jgi:hypothetical protein
VTPMANSPTGTRGTKPPTSSVKLRPRGDPRRQRTDGAPSKPLCQARRNSLSDVERLRRAVLANIANIEAIELMLEKLIGEASPEQLDGLMRGLQAAKADAEAIKALFGPLDENVTNIALVREA